MSEKAGGAIADDFEIVEKEMLSCVAGRGNSGLGGSGEDGSSGGERPKKAERQGGIGSHQPQSLASRFQGSGHRETPNDRQN